MDGRRTWPPARERGDLQVQLDNYNYRQILEMCKRLKRVASFVVTLACSSAALAQSHVAGWVTDSVGFGVSGASIQVMPREGDSVGTVASPGRWAPTDSDGRFSIILQPSRYKIVAKDEPEGYPDPVFALGSDPTATFPTISVGKDDISGVRVSLGAKGGILEGHVNDGATKLPIQKAKVTISDVQEPKAYVDIFTNAGGGFQFTVPNKPVVISATAAGYKTTQFKRGKELTLSGGEHRDVVIELESQTQLAPR